MSRIAISISLLPAILLLHACGASSELGFQPSQRALEAERTNEADEGLGSSIADGDTTDFLALKETDTATPSEKASSRKLAPRQTFLYLINPSAKTSPSSVQVVFQDLFDTAASRISTLKSQGKTVLCYFSAGSSENWRSDYKSIPSSAQGKPLDGWAGEKWLDYRNSSVRNVMKARIKLAAQKGCHGVDPDNIDGHLNNTGFKLTSKDQLSYMSFLRGEAKALGLLIGAKNSAETAGSLEPLTDFAVVEECFKYKECGSYSVFARRGKPLFHIEYSSASKSLCDSAAKSGGTLIFANYDLTKFTVCK